MNKSYTFVLVVIRAIVFNDTELILWCFLTGYLYPEDLSDGLSNGIRWPLHVPDIFLDMVFYVFVILLRVVCCEVTKKAMHALFLGHLSFFFLVAGTKCFMFFGFWIYNAYSKVSIPGMLIHMLDTNTAHSRVVLYGGSVIPSLCRMTKTQTL